MGKTKPSRRARTSPAEAPEPAAPALRLTVLDDTFAVCRLPAEAVVPEWAWTGEVACVTRTRDELSKIGRAHV